MTAIAAVLQKVNWSEQALLARVQKLYPDAKKISSVRRCWFANHCGQRMIEVETRAADHCGQHLSPGFGVTICVCPDCTIGYVHYPSFD